MSEPTHTDNPDQAADLRALVRTGQGEYRRDIHPADIEPLPAWQSVLWFSLLGFIVGAVIGMFLY